jgi:hypothetical protein
VIPHANGTLQLETLLARPGRYAVWVGGSIRGRLSVYVNRTLVGTVERHLQNAGQWLELGTVAIPGGPQRVSLRVSLPKLAPGTGGGVFPLGPLVLQRVGSNRLLEPAVPQALCGRNLDWIEALVRSVR